MTKTEFNIGNIPAVLWGGREDRLFIAVHGDQSNKEDAVIELFAREAEAKGARTLSFDLPEHGGRKGDPTKCNPQNCRAELKRVIDYACGISRDVSLFAVSIGAYFSLLAYEDEEIERALFLSPIVNMEFVIANMMNWFGVSEERLMAEREITTPAKVLYWDYYSYVKAHPVSKWNTKTAILYGENDNLTALDEINDFSNRFDCSLTVMENGEHFFHTEEQIGLFKCWLEDNF